MKLFITTNGWLFKDAKGGYYTPVIYGYDFFRRYLEVFEELVLVAHCEERLLDISGPMLRVDGPGIEIIEVPFPHGKLDYLKKSRAINTILKGAAKRCDAALLRVPDQLAFSAYRYLRANRTPLAAEVTSDPIHLFRRGEYKKNFRIAIKYLWYFKLKYLCAYADGVSYVTENELQKRYPCGSSRKYGLPAFTTWYTDTDVSITTNNVDRRGCAKSREWRLLHVAASIEGNAKGHKELFLALNILISGGYNVKLTLVGGGSLNEENREIVNRYELDKNIEYTGRLKQDEVISHMQNADLLVYPSYCEGLPRVVVEAMSCGLPCVLSDIPAHRAMIDSKYLAKKKDSADLADHIKDLIDHEDRYINACDDVLKAAFKYDSDQVKKKRFGFYEKLRSFASTQRRN